MTARTSSEMFLNVATDLAVTSCCMSTLSTRDLLSFSAVCFDFAHVRSFDTHPYVIILLKGISDERVRMLVNNWSQCVCRQLSQTFAILPKMLNNNVEHIPDVESYLCKIVLGGN